MPENELLQLPVVYVVPSANEVEEETSPTEPSPLSIIDHADVVRWPGKMRSLATEKPFTFAVLNPATATPLASRPTRPNRARMTGRRGRRDATLAG